MPQEYVVVFVKTQFFDPTGKYDDPIIDSHIFVEKNRPLNQKGRYNLPGGKIEPGETPIQAAERELKEETGLTCSNTEVMGRIQGSWGVVHCVFALVYEFEINPREGETERMFWSTWDDVKTDPKLMPNLRITIPLMMSGLKDWIIEDDGANTVDGFAHQGARVTVITFPVAAF